MTFLYLNNIDFRQLVVYNKQTNPQKKKRHFDNNFFFFLLFYFLTKWFLHQIYHISKKRITIEFMNQLVKH